MQWFQKWIAVEGEIELLSVSQRGPEMLHRPLLVAELGGNAGAPVAVFAYVSKVDNLTGDAEFIYAYPMEPYLCPAE